MNSSKDIIRRVYSALAEQLKGMGFRKHTPGIFTCELNDELAGWIGLNVAPYQLNAVSIGPFIGVRHHRLEAAISELLDLRTTKYVTPSIATNIGYLAPAPSYRMWTFTPDNLNEMVADMVSVIVELGGAFMRQNADLLSLCHTMCNSGLGAPYLLEYHVPIAFALLGKKAEAEDYLKSKLGEKAAETDMAAEQYRKFATNLTKKLFQN